MFNERRAANRKELSNSQKKTPNSTGALPTTPEIRANNDKPSQYTNNNNRGYASSGPRQYHQTSRPSRFPGELAQRPRDGRDIDPQRDLKSNYRDNRYQRPNDNKGINQNNYNSRDEMYQRYDNRGTINNNNHRGGNRGGRERFPTGPTASRTIPLDQIKVEKSLWDKVPAGYEGTSAARVKACGLFPIPGSDIKNLQSSQIQKILNKNLKFRMLSIEDSQLTPLDSRISKTLIVSGFNKNEEDIKPERIQKYFESFLISTIIPTVDYEDHSIDIRASSDPNKLIVETTKSIVATTLLALNGMKIAELDIELTIERPNEYIVFNPPLLNREGEEDASDEIYDEIIESNKLFTLVNIPFGTSREDVVDILSKHGKLKSLSLLLDKLSYESKGIGFFEYTEVVEDAEKLINDIEEEEIDTNKLKCFRSCWSKNNYEQSIKLSADLLIDNINPVSHRISKHKTSTVLKFVNCLTFEDLINPLKYKQFLESFEEECGKFGDLVKVSIPKPPNDDFKRGIDEMKPEYGLVFVQFENKSDAADCLNGLAGRLFNNRLVLIGYIDEMDFRLGLL